MKTPFDHWDTWWWPNVQVLMVWKATWNSTESIFIYGIQNRSNRSHKNTVKWVQRWPDMVWVCLGFVSDSVMTVEHRFLWVGNTMLFVYVDTTNWCLWEISRKHVQKEISIQVWSLDFYVLSSNKIIFDFSQSSNCTWKVFREGVPY